jgi:hypothetical protein
MGTQAQCTTSGSGHRTILLTLKRGGTSLAGIGWAQMLLSVDRLSRRARVSLEIRSHPVNTDFDRGAPEALEGSERIRITLLCSRRAAHGRKSGKGCLISCAH